MAVSATRVAEVVDTAGIRADHMERTAAKSGEKAAGATQSDGFDVWTRTLAGLPGARKEKAAETRKAAADSWQGEWARTDSAGVGTSLEQQASDALRQFELLTGQREAEPGEEDPKGFAGGLGATFGILTSLEQMISAPLAMLPFPAFPALRVTDMDIGLPHGHSHPPNLVPPAPLVMLPSTGPIIPIPFLSGATQTLINGMPAGRCGDMGLGIWCGGYFPMYEVFLGSSSVWIEGARAGRLLVDVTRHCMFSSPKPQDQPLGPMVGMTITASPNVLVGGVPMPSLLDLAMGVAIEALFKGIGKALKRAKELHANRLAHAVNAAEKEGGLIDDALNWFRKHFDTRPTDADYWDDLVNAKFINATDEIDRANEAFRALSQAEEYVDDLLKKQIIFIEAVDDELADMVRKDLVHVAANPVGRSTLERIARSGKKTRIKPGRGKRALAYAHGWKASLWDEAMGAPGKGAHSTVEYDPARMLAHDATPDSILHHELSHAANNAEGTNRGWSNKYPRKQKRKWYKKAEWEPGPRHPEPEPASARPGMTEEERIAEATDRWTNLEEQNVIRNQCNPYREQYNKEPRWGHRDLRTVPSN